MKSKGPLRDILPVRRSRIAHSKKKMFPLPSNLFSPRDSLRRVKARGDVAAMLGAFPLIIMGLCRAYWLRARLLLRCREGFGPHTLKCQAGEVDERMTAHILAPPPPLQPIAIIKSGCWELKRNFDLNKRCPCSLWEHHLRGLLEHQVILTLMRSMLYKSVDLVGSLVEHP